MTATHAVVVIAGGISGLVCAWALARVRKDTLLVEAMDRPGASIRSERRDGFLIEHGPHSFSGAPTLPQFCRELSIEDQIVSVQTAENSP